MFTLCLATSAVKGEPHRVTIKLQKSDVCSVDVCVRGSQLAAHCRDFAALQHVNGLHCSYNAIGAFRGLLCCFIEYKH